MSGGALGYECPARLNEKDIDGGKGSDGGLWWHVGALGALECDSVRSALINTPNSLAAKHGAIEGTFVIPYSTTR